MAAIENAHRALLGEDAIVLPEFELTPEHGGELRNAVQLAGTGDPLAHLAATHDAPVDDWLHGIARVRPKLHAWETLLLIGGALGAGEPELTPIQLPYRADEPWLGLEHPAAPQIDGERLLYTAHHATAFDPARRQCGLLVDEWTEVLPGRVRDDRDRVPLRPAEQRAAAGHALVALPAEQTGAWDVADIVDAISETLDLARLRAVEPDLIDDTPLGRSSCRRRSSRPPCTRSRSGRALAHQPLLRRPRERRWLRNTGSRTCRRPCAERGFPTVTCGTASRDGRAPPISCAACVPRCATPLWMLSRQWQLGEFRADDAGSAVEARLHVESQPILALQARRRCGGRRPRPLECRSRPRP